MASSPHLNEADLQKLKAQYLTQKDDAAASQIQGVMDDMNRLKVQVGLLGERGAGVSLLVEALLNKPRRVTDAAAYFRDTPEAVMYSVGHIHPTFPQLTLHVLPGFEASEKPAAYLRRLGDVNRFNFLVMMVGDTSQDHYLQVLKATGKRFLLARTKIDLDLHTAKRRLQFRQNPAEQMGRIRKELDEKLAKNGLRAENVFLVSGLETERYDFAGLKDSLEGEVLGLKRHHTRNLEDFGLVSLKVVKKLYEICKSGSLVEVPALIQATLEDPSQIRLDIAVIGEAGSGKSSLINALRGVDCEEPEAAPTGATERTMRAIPYQFPGVPNVYLWDLPGVGVTEDDVNRLDLSRYGFFLLVASERYRHTHSCFARVIASMGKQSFLVRNKIDVDLEAQSGKQLSKLQSLLEQVRKSCVQALKNDQVDSPVFLVSSFVGEGYDLPLLREELRSQASELKRKALRRAIPTFVDQLVRRKAQVLLKDTWRKAQQVCLISMDNPKETVAKNLLATIASFCIDLGLDNGSVARIAQAVSKDVCQLQAEIRSPFTGCMKPADMLSRVMKPPSLISWAWNYVPYWGQGAKAEPEVSFESVYGMLKQAVVELSEDAKNLLLAAFAEG